MSLEQKLSEEDKKYILIELERERLKDETLKLYHDSVKIDSIQIKGSVLKSLDILSFFYPEMFISLLETYITNWDNFRHSSTKMIHKFEDNIVIYDNHFIEGFMISQIKYLFNYEILKILPDIALDVQDTLIDFKDLSNSIRLVDSKIINDYEFIDDLPIFEWIKKNILSNKNPQFKDKLNQLINKVYLNEKSNEKRITEIKDNLLLETLTYNKQIFSQKWQETIEQHIELIIADNYGIVNINKYNDINGDISFIEEKCIDGEICIDYKSLNFNSEIVKAILHRIIDENPIQFINYFKTKIEFITSWMLGNQYTGEYDKGYKYGDRDDDGYFPPKTTKSIILLKYLAESLNYLLISISLNKNLPLSDNNYMLFCKNYVDNVKIKKNKIHEHITAINSEMNINKNKNNKSEKYKQMNAILSFGEIKTISELIECSNIKSPYKIVSKLGQGTSGTTYKVYSPELKQYFALKIINDKFSPKEAELMAKLKGEDLENIVQIHDASSTLVNIKGIERFTIVMEYVDGDLLKTVIKKGITKSSVLRYSAQLLNGISSLTSYGIIHRDINPENIKINSKDIVKILDFGIATEQHNVITQGGRRYSVPTDMDPNDLFSLGLITYEMYTNEHLILKKNELMKTQTHANKIAYLKESMFSKGELKKEYREKIPEEIESVILSCIYNKPLDEIRQSFINIKKELRYLFMTKNQLISRINELETK